MYTTLDLKTLLSDKALMEKYKGYKLCYVDAISPTVFDYDEEARKIISSPIFHGTNIVGVLRSIIYFECVISLIQILNSMRKS